MKQWKEKWCLENEWKKRRKDSKERRWETKNEKRWEKNLKVELGTTGKAAKRDKKEKIEKMLLRKLR